jgi:PIN domain nuclease of toxin-antitoxin system
LAPPIHAALLAEGACRALARDRGAVAVTADRSWASLPLDVALKLLR